MLFDRFNGIMVFDFCIDHLVILLTVTALLPASAAAVLVYIGIKQKRVIVSKELSSDSGKTLSLGAQELYKQLVAYGGIYVIIAFIVIRVIWAGYYFRPTALYHELAFADYMLRLEGEVTDEKLSWIDEEYAYIEKSLAEYPEIQSAYREGKVSHDEYTRASGRYSYAKHYKEAAEQLIIRADYLTEKAKTHENIMFVDDRGYRRLIFAPPDMITAAAAIILFSRLFPANTAAESRLSSALQRKE